MRKFQPIALVLCACATLAACGATDRHIDVTIRWSETKQTIDGFGASSAFFGETITNDVADQLFDAKKGIGLSLLRTQIGLPDDVQDDGSEPADGTAMPVASAPGLVTALQATLRGTKVWATAWTPPPIWKTTNNKNGSGSGYASNKLDPVHYQDYANYLADFVDLMAKNNVPIIGLSPANEPDYTASWDGAQWKPNELTTFISQNLGPTLSQRFPDVKIVAPDTASWPNVDSYLTPMLADPAAKDYLSVVATHPYQNGSQPIQLDYKKPAQNGKQFWQTEWSQENPKGDTPNPTMTSAMDMMRHLHDHMVVANMNAWSWWAIYVNADALTGEGSTTTRQNPALIQPDASYGDSYMFKRGYALGNWSKFVRPGFQRIVATDKPTNAVLIEAYRDAMHIAVIAVNTSSKTITQKFILDGGTFGTLTPWVTSPDDNLAAKDPFTAYDTFTYDLPASSVVTFVNWDATTETPGQGTLPGDVDGGTDVRISTGLDCPNALVPNNGGSGGVTDFTDWKGGSGRWGNQLGLWGNIYAYKGPDGSTMSAAVENQTLHVTGAVTANDYGGAGLSFQVCTTVVSFTHVQFTLSGSSPGCDLELQIKTFDQQPKQQTPPGGCDQNYDSCYNFPVKKQVAVPTAEPMVITTPLADFTKWSAANAGQVVGLQWQFTGTNVGPDAGASCPIDVRITGIKFVQMDAGDAGASDAADAGTADAGDDATTDPVDAADQ
jgi:glucuronoarabinoxylan endo-1,4-beta-xylanase